MYLFMMMMIIIVSHCSRGQSGEKLVMETEYPYKEKTGLCQVFPQSHGGVSVKDYAVFDFRYRVRKRKKEILQGSNNHFYTLFSLVFITC